MIVFHCFVSYFLKTKYRLIYSVIYTKTGICMQNSGFICDIYCYCFIVTFYDKINIVPLFQE